MRLDHLFAGAAEVRGHNLALRWADGEWSYADLASAVETQVARLVPVVSAGDVVVIAVADSRELIVCYWAVLALDAVAVLSCRDSSPGGDESGVARLVGANVVIHDGGVARRGPAPGWVEAAPEPPALVLLTSGTTGMPKAIVHSHRSLAWGVWNTASIADEALGLPRPVPADTASLAADLRDRVLPEGPALAYYSGMPWDTVSALAVVHKALTLGDTLVLHEGRFDPRQLLDLLVRGGVQNLALAPFMAQVLLRVVGAQRRPVDGLLAVGLGGAAVEARLVREVEDRLGCVVTVGYGATESGGVLTMTSPSSSLEIRSTTVGRPVAAVDLRLDAGGEIRCRTPAAMIGTLERGSVVPAGEWLVTGDLGSFDDEGHLRVHGRADYVILRGARRIDPARLEFALQSHPAITRAAVTGVPSRVAGEQDVVALVVVSAPLSAEAVKRFAQLALGVGEAPQRVVFVQELPTTADGAVRRHLLPAVLSHAAAGA